MYIILYLQNDFKGATDILNRIVRKYLGKDEKIRFLHLAINHSELPFANRIVEDVYLYQVAAWNLALISCQQKKDTTITNVYLKKVKPKGKELLVDKRVRNWIHYYRENKKDALEKAQQLLSHCEKVEYLHKDVCIDLEIFRSEVPINS